MSHKRILVVDDKEDNLYLMRALLGGNGYVLQEARHGAEALELARKTPPDLIITDILMPVMDGFALCRECKKDPALQTIPLVFYTATYTDERDRDFALSLGAARFIVKPEEPEAFIQTIREVLDAPQELEPVAEEPAEEKVFLKQYNETLIRKLESKTEQLKQANRELRQQLAELEQSERKLRENEQRYREIFNATSEGIFIQEVNTGRILDVNNSVLRLYGYSSKDDVLRTNIVALSADIPECSQVEVTRYIRNATEQGPQQFEWMAKRSDGSLFPVEVTLRYSYILGRGCILAVVRDITEHKRTNAERDRQLDELRRWQAVMIDNSERNQTLKREVNELLARLGEPPRYSSQGQMG